MRNHWGLFALASIVFLLSACAAHPPQSPQLADLANSWEAQYLDSWGDSGV